MKSDALVVTSFLAVLLRKAASSPTPLVRDEFTGQTFPTFEYLNSGRCNCHPRRKEGFPKGSLSGDPVPKLKRREGRNTGNPFHLTSTLQNVIDLLFRLRNVTIGAIYGSNL
jgi:hypothetical protein